MWGLVRRDVRGAGHGAQSGSIEAERGSGGAGGGERFASAAAVAGEAKAKAKAETEAKMLRRLCDDYEHRFPDRESNPFGEPEPKPTALVSSLGTEVNVSLGLGEGEHGDADVSLGLVKDGGFMFSSSSSFVMCAGELFARKLYNDTAQYF